MQTRSAYLRYIPSLIFTFILIFIWEMYTESREINRVFLPAPTNVFAAFLDNKDIIVGHSAQTLLETLIGFFLAIGLGLSISLVLSLSTIIRRTIYPLLVVSQTIPVVALAPLFLIWFGFDLTPKVLMVVLYCFFPIVVATTDALQNIDKELLDLMKSMNASTWQILRFIRLPNALPAFFSGVKIAATYSVVGAIVGEFVGAYQGLGIYIETAANSHAYALVFAAIAVTSLLSILLFAAVAFTERFVIPWKDR